MIVLAVGCFDLMHYGHLRHLRAAKELGEILYVGVTRDAQVDKGPGRPFFTELQRADMVGSLNCVHQAFLCDSSIDALQQIKPHIFALGKEYKNKVREEDERFCDAHGITIVFTNEPVYSSTRLLNESGLRQEL